MTTDKGIHQHITDLVDEEHRLREQMQDGSISHEDGTARLRTIEATLDQSWDLLRQRQAKRDAGQSVDGAHERSASTVENYLD